MIVLDASAAIDLLLDLPPHSTELRRRLADAGQAAAPHLLDAQVGQGAGKISTRRAAEALEDLQSLPVTRYPHQPLMKRAFALRRNVTIYDALYLALAEALNAALVTRDRALEGVPGARARVDVLAPTGLKCER